MVGGVLGRDLTLTGRTEIGKHPLEREDQSHPRRRLLRLLAEATRRKAFRENMNHLNEAQTVPRNLHPNMTTD